MKYSMQLMLPFVLMAASQAMAQFPRYTPPAGSPIPNELNYFRRDVGVLDPYNAFIEPRRRIDRQFQQLAEQQQLDAQSNRQAITRLRQSEAAPTGTGATFMNYSHYYPRAAVGGSRRAR